jgi:aminopeptidase
MSSEPMLDKYAQLLVRYSLDIQAGDKLYVSSTTLAEPLVREVYREALRAGAFVDVDLSFREQNRIFYQEAEETQLRRLSPLYQLAMETYDAYLYIRAPFNLRENGALDPQKARISQEANQALSETYSRRTATRELKRNLCQYPTQASAQEAGMSLEEYEHFVFSACKLYEPDPIAAWVQLRHEQQHIVDHLNNCSDIHYLGDGVDLRFSTKGRTWINSDGQTNMPSGEVYTSPVEDSVNGVIRYSFPALYGGQEVEGATLYVKDGYIERWEARRGVEVLDQIFRIEGTRRFGEAAIGTNYGIQRMSKNILFDEKIGGTVHLAIGQSYLQTGGKNQSPVHWDMITDMRNGGEIYADGEKIYVNGRFLI